MIGHFLGTLTKKQEDRVLTEKLARAPNYITADGCRCLLGVTANIGFDGFREGRDQDVMDRAKWPGFARPAFLATWPRGPAVVGARFDQLVSRFGPERINAAIRNRILSNRARRVLTSRVERCDAEQVPA